MLIDPDGGDAIEAVRVIDQEPFPFGQDRVVGGMPCDPQMLRDPGHREVVTDHRAQRPPHPAMRDLPAWLRHARHVFTPGPPAMRTRIPAHPDQERGRPVAERGMREPAWHSVPQLRLRPTCATPRIRLGLPALQDSFAAANILTGHDQSEVVEPAERGEARRGEGSVGHVEVFRMESVVTPIIGRPRHSPPQRRARPLTHSQM